MFLWQIVLLVSMILFVSCSSINTSVKPIALSYSELTAMREGEKNFVGRTRESVLQEIGEPLKIEHLKVLGVKKEKHLYQIIENEFIERIMWLVLYYEGDVVTGFNIYNKRPLDSEERLNIVPQTAIGSI